METGRVLDAMQRQSVFHYFSYINLDCDVNHHAAQKKKNPMALQFHPDRPFSILRICCSAGKRTKRYSVTHCKSRAHRSSSSTPDRLLCAIS